MPDVRPQLPGKVDLALALSGRGGSSAWALSGRAVRRRPAVGPSLWASPKNVPGLAQVISEGALSTARRETERFWSAVGRQARPNNGMQLTWLIGTQIQLGRLAGAPSGDRGAIAPPRS